MTRLSCEGKKGNSLEGLGGRNQSTYDRERVRCTRLRSWPGPREERGREELDVVLNRIWTGLDHQLMD